MKNQISILFAAVVALMVFPAGAAAYDHEVTVKGMSFSWSIEGTTLQGKISAKTTGWVAVGFNPTEKMKDANIVIGYVKDGAGTVADHFGKSATSHVDDTELGGTNDVSLVSAVEENGTTTIEFTMPMDSADRYDGTLSPNDDTVLIMAYGPDRDSFKPRHSFRGSKTVNLGTGAEK